MLIFSSQKLICEIESGNNMKQGRTIATHGHEINSYDKEERERERETSCNLLMTLLFAGTCVRASESMDISECTVRVSYIANDSILYGCVEGGEDMCVERERGFGVCKNDCGERRPPLCRR